MTDRRSFLAAILALLGWKPETLIEPDCQLRKVGEARRDGYIYFVHSHKEDRIMRKHDEGDGWSDASLSRDVTIRPVVIFRISRKRSFPELSKG